MRPSILPPSYARVSCPADLLYEAQHGPIRTEEAPLYSLRKGRQVNIGRKLSKWDVVELRKLACCSTRLVTLGHHNQATILHNEMGWNFVNVYTIEAVLRRWSWVWVQ